MMILIGSNHKLGMTESKSELLKKIHTELERMEQMLLPLDGAQEPMRAALERIISSGGKRLRPILAYLCYRMGGSQAHPIVPLMCMLEFMHTASLIHDDVVDNARLRRGIATINSTSGVEEAVQSGDFLLAEAMTRLHFYRSTGINEELIRVSSEMCLGELEQLKGRFEPENQSCAQYYFQIHRKTASLIAASCYTGAIAGGLPESEAGLLKAYGENLGAAFQLTDDLLDFSEQPAFGKMPGQDLKNGIFTLPVLYLLEEGIPEAIRNLIQKRMKDEDDMKCLISFINESSALEYTKMIIRRKSTEAVDALRDFPKSVEKAALTELAEELSERHA